MSKELTDILIKDKIAHGAFGEIHECLDIKTGNKLAIKIEKKSCVLQLQQEYFIYKSLTSSLFPAVYEYGKIQHEGNYYNCMTMELLGQSLEKHFNNCNRTFSLKTVFLIAKSALRRIEYVHHRHFVHRDIKPENFVVDRNFSKIYLIDFGLAKEYRNPNTLIHKPLKTGKNLTGTARYASLNTHFGFEQSRRDDLESLGFLLVYFMKGNLPWQGLKAPNKYEKYEKIKNLKEKTSILALCEFLPKEIYFYLINVRNLKYEENPDYAYLEDLFETGLRRRGLEDDGVFDWMIKRVE